MLLSARTLAEDEIPLARAVRGERAAVLTPAGPLTVGTAGHVDHGKTALVAALTGTDTDRLPEEKVRGLSIELGFAAVNLPSGRPMSLVDVPGHERFIRAMVAGATGIDAYLMVIAASEGVREQTVEHARILGRWASTPASWSSPRPISPRRTRPPSRLGSCCRASG